MNQPTQTNPWIAVPQSDRSILQLSQDLIVDATLAKYGNCSVTSIHTGLQTEICKHKTYVPVLPAANPVSHAVLEVVHEVEKS